MNIYFLETVEPSAAQAAQCSSVRKAIDADKWMCKLLPGGNATMFSGGANALTHEEAKAIVNTAEFNGEIP